MGIALQAGGFAAAELSRVAVIATALVAVTTTAIVRPAA
jgi:hypothetical protein